jgi:glycosyltransferase involved in cell wall biosynthesis
MKKLIIQMPCYNEEEALPVSLAHLPREVPGFDTVEWLIIDDGSSDRTVEVAKELGVDHIVRHHQNLGLAKAYMTGLRACLENGADVIVNTDADNQYDASCIPDLVKPILEGRAQIVVGARPINEIEHFSPVKKFLQRLGSWTVRFASGTDIPDAPSGFRALARDAALQINVFNNYTYTLETIIQAGQKQIPITWVPVKTNAFLRESRLVKSIPSYIRRSILTIFRIFVVYRPFRFFITIGSVLFSLGFLLGLRFLIIYFAGEGGGHVQSLILAAVLIMMGFQVIMTAFVADLLAVNRRMIEELQLERRNTSFCTPPEKKDES